MLIDVNIYIYISSPVARQQYGNFHPHNHNVDPSNHPWRQIVILQRYKRIKKYKLNAMYQPPKKINKNVFPGYLPHISKSSTIKKLIPHCPTREEPTLPRLY